MPDTPLPLAAVPAPCWRCGGTRRHMFGFFGRWPGALMREDWCIECSRARQERENVSRERRGSTLFAAFATA